MLIKIINTKDEITKELLIVTGLLKLRKINILECNGRNNEIDNNNNIDMEKIISGLVLSEGADKDGKIENTNKEILKTQDNPSEFQQNDSK